MNSICIHCHFYQPPRENAWLEEIEVQDSAYPYHDWNERVMAECYAPNLAARILDGQKRITQIVDNYSKISFDFGPTLLSWMVRHAPEAYRGILDADKESQRNFSGHGSAIAQAYNHMIMPLANSRDKKTQIRWGLDDFAARFGRLPESMWLPETAVDLESLDLMAQAGIKFVILAPHQARAVRPLAGGDWQDVSGSKIDPSRAYVLRTPGGNSINLFFYDGPISQAVAFENLLDNGSKFAHRLLTSFSDARTWPQLGHIATDGETYGHHHKYGEMALAYALSSIQADKSVQLTNYGEFLERNPPAWEVQIIENTSWSCVHGIERWRSNCGCNSGKPGWNQEWRKPLREALDWLRDFVSPKFETLGSTLLRDPWAARDAYIQVMLNRSPEVRERFGHEHFARELNETEQVTVWKLMELQRHAMLMYTSCGWFFDDISGIETVQVIQYAARVVQLAQQLFGDTIEQQFVEKLSAAKSNVPEKGDGAKIYEENVKPAMVDLEKVGAHYSISSLFLPYGDCTDIFSYTAKRLDYRTRAAGKFRMAVGQSRFTSKVTQESQVLTFCAVHFGDHEVIGGVEKAQPSSGYEKTLDEISSSFDRADTAEVIRYMDKRFGGKTYSLRSLFRDEQRKIVRTVLSSAVTEADAAYLQMYERHAPLMRFVTTLGIPLPREFGPATGYAINSLLRQACSSEQLDRDRVLSMLHEAQTSKITLDNTTLEFLLRRTVEALATRFVGDASNMDHLNRLRSALEIVAEMPFKVNLWSVQNQIYSLKDGLYKQRQQEAQGGDQKAQEWVAGYLRLSELLSIRVQ
jgi:alpha-amylase/alpha-mannosidase (GH57 family)